jgi:hypothetical protein
MTQQNKKHLLSSFLRIVGITFLACFPFLFLRLAPLMPDAQTCLFVLFLGGFLSVTEVVLSLIFLLSNVRTNSPLFLVFAIALFLAYLFVGAVVYVNYTLRGL